MLPSGKSISALQRSMAEISEELQRQLAEMIEEHGDLDASIAALQASPVPNHIQLQRLKKKKLYLKDQIADIRDTLTPDIIA